MPINTSFCTLFRRVSGCTEGVQIFPQMNSRENLIDKRPLTMLKDCFLSQFSREFNEKSIPFKHRVLYKQKSRGLDALGTLL